ncbi:hypothetical protein [Methanimicrococcus hacksteinii]|uniref:hypothetical protein n=1 Tax=Methanimicrococcus hacksteinii TaxID=3028293 RepID=UPI00298F08BB|nr:hypothetical protein [Methanimicrococcus sp. At1]
MIDSFKLVRLARAGAAEAAGAAETAGAAEATGTVEAAGAAEAVKAVEAAEEASLPIGNCIDGICSSCGKRNR